MNNMGLDAQSQKDANEPIAMTFKNKQEIACTRASVYVADWLKGNGIHCSEIIFDKKIIEKDRDLFKYLIRAVDKFNGKAYMFELSCKERRLQVGYTHSSQNPVHFSPGDITIPVKKIS